MQIIKASGELERFNSKKIYFSVRQAGGSSHLANDAVKAVKKKVKEKTSTQEILKFLLEFLKREPGVSQRYDLKRAIMSLGPSGFPFEDFFARVLEFYEYKTDTNQSLKGKMIIQEVDITAEKDKQKWMVECKYHNEPGSITRLDPAMYTYARFLDISKYNFTGSWLVTNTKCSDDAINYSIGVNQKITSWNYPKEESLMKLIENKKLYPITILKTLTPEILGKFYQIKLIVANDLLDKDADWLIKKIGVSQAKAKEIIDETKVILEA